MSPAIRVTVWNEHVHERRDEPVASIYPHGIHTAIADGLRARLEDAATIRTATLADPDHGLSQALLHDTDVLVWWGHVAHRDVADEAVTRVHEHVLAGMGLVTPALGPPLEDLRPPHGDDLQPPVGVYHLPGVQTVLANAVRWAHNPAATTISHS